MRTIRWLTTAGVLLVLSPSAWQASPTAWGGVSKSPIVSPAGAPPGTETLAVQWVNIAVPDLGVVLAAVVRPPGAAPFPAVVLLHGSDGFAREYVRLAQDLARGGLLAVAACWSQGGGGAGSLFITPIACPKSSPSIPDPFGRQAMQTVDALVQAARTLPGARPDRIALFGHSRDGIATLNYIQQVGGVQAAVLDSGGYPGPLVDRASHVKVPILMLHGTADGPADGGGTSTNVRLARDFEAARRAAGAPVEAVYYEGGRHNGIFSSSTQYSDEVRRIVAFLRRYLH